MTKNIYLDHAATTKLDERVLEKMMPYLTENFGNANSVHTIGRQAVSGLDDARDLIANIINCKPEEVYFTSCGTEGDNWALRGVSFKNKFKGNIVTSSIEHSAMMNTLDELSYNGIESRFVSPKQNGICSPKDFEDKIDNNTILVSLMMANNEVGSIQPVKEVCEIAHSKGSIFFTDAVQTMGAMNIDVKDLGIDMLSCSGHKFNGPKGTGFVYIKNRTGISPIITGGYQERGKRGGTSNVAGCVGIAEALRLNRETLLKDNEYITSTRNYFIDRVLSEIPNCYLNGDRKKRLPNNANILFRGINGESLLYLLDLNGICASLGAACSAGSIKPSSVLREIGLLDEEAKSSIRFTFGRENTKEEVDYTIDVIKDSIKKISGEN